MKLCLQIIDLFGVSLTILFGVPIAILTCFSNNDTCIHKK
jgi:hypothetical protein